MAFNCSGMIFSN